MANSIALAKNYIPLLDEVYKYASLTSVLDSNPAGMRQGANANEILIQKLSMDGLADYSRPLSVSSNIESTGSSIAI